jgi:hypothetical protein
VPEPLPPHQQAFLHETVDGLAHRDARNAEIVARSRSGGKASSGRVARLDRRPERALQLLVQRPIVHLAQGPMRCARVVKFGSGEASI